VSSQPQAIDATPLVDALLDEHVISIAIGRYDELTAAGTSPKKDPCLSHEGVSTCVGRGKAFRSSLTATMVTLLLPSAKALRFLESI
jgi:hypothetical protein